MKATWSTAPKYPRHAHRKIGCEPIPLSTDSAQSETEKPIFFQPGALDRVIHFLGFKSWIYQISIQMTILPKGLSISVLYDKRILLVPVKLWFPKEISKIKASIASFQQALPGRK